MGATTRPLDLLGVAFMAGGAAVLAWVDVPLALRILIGMPLVLLLPGYAVLATTHPGIGADQPGRKRVRSLAMADRLVLSVVLSLLASLLVGLVLNFTPLGISARTTTASLALFTLLATGVALAARLFDTPLDRRPEFRWPSWRPLPWHEKASLGALALAVVVLAVAGSVFLDEVRDEGYVSLFVEPNHLVDCYPLQYANGTYTHNAEGGSRCPAGPANLTLIVNNHEAHAIDYVLRLEWSRTPGAEEVGGLLASQSEGRLEPLPRGDSNGSSLQRQHTQPLDPGPPPFEGLQYLKVHLFIDRPAVGAPDHALQLRVQA